MKIKKENYGKFILKGSLALEYYNDCNKDYVESFNSYNKKLKEYRNNKLSKEEIVNELISVIETIGVNHFIIYDDGDVGYKK